MIGLRVRIKPKSKKADHIWRYDMKKVRYMWVTDRKYKWTLMDPNSGMQIHVHPKNDPDWIIIR